jgi:magnesium transporter
MLATAGVCHAWLTQGDVRLAVLVAVTIISIVVVGCVVGGMMPLLLHRVGIDPASSSTPFIATVVDVLGIVIYLSLASWLMSDVLAQAATSAG